VEPEIDAVALQAIESSSTSCKGQPQQGKIGALWRCSDSSASASLSSIV